jgi:alpha-mannosidase
MTPSAKKTSPSDTIDPLRDLAQLDVIPDWQVCEQDCAISELPSQVFTTLTPNEKNYLVWEKGRKVRWFYQVFVIPAALQSYPLVGLTLRLALTWWAELAEVFINGEKVQEGDLFDHSCRLVLSESAQPGERVEVAIRLVSPGHDIGGLMRSRLLYESDYDSIDPSYVADELAMIENYRTHFAPDESLEFDLDWSVLSDRTQFDQELQNLRDRLMLWSDRIKQHEIHLLGHAHLDMAWLWDVEETWRAAVRTFTSVLNLQNEFPDLTFCHTTPALYEWIEQNRPDLFGQIKERVQEGRWEIVGGMWVEPEMNLISGEAIARHLLYGQRYWQEKFGTISRVEWLPDTFGFNWQLPQFLQQAGIDYFVTQKFRWNDTNKYPHEIFNWQAPNGSQVFSLMSSPIGEGIDPIKMSDYAWEWTTRTQTMHCLWLFGVGDHGGGPTRDMLHLQQRWAKSPFFPTMHFTSALKYLESFTNLSGSPTNDRDSLTNDQDSLTNDQDSPTNDQDSPTNDQDSLTNDRDSLTNDRGSLTNDRGSHTLPVWNDELYLEFHRGCYTTHGDQKRANQVCQTLLYEAELWASLAAIALHEPYPKAELETIWKELLFNQFHDILPGSSISKVFMDANEVWSQIQYEAMDIELHSRKVIASYIQPLNPPQPDAQLIVVFNSLNWQRSEVVSLSISHPDYSSAYSATIQDLEGKEIQTHNSWSSHESIQFVSFLANEVPPIGYRCFWLCLSQAASQSAIASPQDASVYLENDFLRVTIDADTGDLSSIFDKQNQREVLQGSGNQLQAFRDEGQYWDAWNIDPKYADFPLPPAQLLSLETDPKTFSASDNAKLPFQSKVQVKRKIGQSVFQQIYRLEQGSPILEITTFVDWQDRHTVVKTAFPFALEADFATYEISAGTIQRTTKPETPFEKAMWEVSALNWADLSDETYGVSILSDCKHGYDARSNQLRLTLLRGSAFPDPEADLGQHTFTYAIYPHAGSWQAAQTPQKAAELKHALQVVKLNSIPTAGTLPPVASLLDLQSDHLMLSSLKQSEDDPQTWMMRCYECHGEPAELRLKSDLGLSIVESVDILEHPDGGDCAIAPWQVRTFKLKRGEPQPTSD